MPSSRLEMAFRCAGVCNILISFLEPTFKLSGTPLARPLDVLVGILSFELILVCYHKSVEQTVDLLMCFVAEIITEILQRVLLVF